MALSQEAHRHVFGVHSLVPKHLSPYKPMTKYEVDIVFLSSLLNKLINLLHSDTPEIIFYGIVKTEWRLLRRSGGAGRCVKFEI